MLRSLPGFQFAYLSYSVLIAGLFMFSAWRAIDSDTENLQPYGMTGKQADIIHPKSPFGQTIAKVGRLNSSERGELLVFCQEIRKLELRQQGDGISDLLLFTPSEDMIPAQNLRSLPPYRFEKRVYKTPIVNTTLFKSNGRGPNADLANYPAKLDIPVSSRGTSPNRNVQVIHPGGFQSRTNPASIPHDVFLSGIEDCYYALTLQCGQIVSGTNIYQDTSTTYLQDCNNNAFYNYRGVVWHHIIGTGDYMRVKGSSSGGTAEMHLFSGSCDTLLCIGGAYSIQSSEKVIAVTTTPGEHYFIMLANYNIPAPNMNYVLEIECCSNNALYYSPPNNFDSTFVLTARTNNTITANNLIGKGASIVYNGALGVNLNAGFEVANQAVFQADINGCLITPPTAAGDVDNERARPLPNAPAGFLNTQTGPLIHKDPTALLMHKNE